MSTRSRTRSATAAAATAATVATTAPTTPVTTRSRKAQKPPVEGPTAEADRVTQSEDKENDVKPLQVVEASAPASGRNVKRKVQASAKAEGKAKAPAKAYCTCRGPDDGTPMVRCASCHEWYHFKCVQLTEEVAEDIALYVCPPCADKTGLRTTMEWEGPEALEPVEPEPKSNRATSSRSKSSKATGQGTRTSTKKHVELDLPSSESDGNADSEDDYVSDEKGKGRGEKRRIHKRVSDDSDVSMSDGDDQSHSRRSSSIGVKRRRLSTRENNPKRKRSDSSTPATDDPTRKYCLAKGTDELTEEETQKLKEKANEFTTGLEQCLYELYSEPDKTSAQITPKEISTMSSTDLANEETKQSIKMLEQESLEHSILQKVTAPRAKITHKGLQDIEDVNGAQANQRERDRERERQKEEEERIERERLARLRTQRQRTQSMSVPPESPTSAAGNWGGPPPLPMHALASPISPEENGPTLMADFAGISAEPELNLADLINIDDDLQVATAEPTMTETASAEANPPQTSAPVLAASTTGISPFSPNAPKPEVPTPPQSFDLNAIWSAPSADMSEAEPTTTPPGSPPGHLLPSITDVSDAMAGLEATGADDGDFDMFLDDAEPGPSADVPPPVQEVNFESLPPVWTGKLSMPLDSTIPQETPVIARQIGGRPLDADSLLWRTLFPSDILRIEGRVPIDKSGEYLLQMRMNPGKELIAAAFSPVSEEHGSPLQVISDFLVGKARHGLIFPWGHRPKDYHPGRELYMIPLRASEPLPDYIDMLDSLCLPKERSANYLIGIWILQKGKLAAPPPSHLPHISTGNLDGHSPTLPTPPFPTASPVTAPRIEPSVLAAEVASLTPEQIQMMLRSLTSSSVDPLPIPGVSAPLSQPSVPPTPPLMPPPPGHHDQWSNLGYGSYRPEGPPTNYPPYPPDNRGGYEKRYDDYPPSDRGERGRGRGRGRGGRGRGRRDDDFNRRPSDSGWSRPRGRNGNDHREDRHQRREQWT
ncbi:hypothetical protein ONZ45_g2046 [Pleurotus djamor]|nr:hypothetical protein ONZ45_g2046 [Pleurotus djamor]